MALAAATLCGDSPCASMFGKTRAATGVVPIRNAARTKPARVELEFSVCMRRKESGASAAEMTNFDWPLHSCYGNVKPDLAFTAEISDALIAPDAFTSNLKLRALVV